MRSQAGKAAIGIGAALLFLGFMALGTWQLQRRVWKLDLIERVDHRIHAPASAAPGPPEWPVVSAARDEYRHVEVHGRYLPEAAIRVQAVTELGPGFWLLAPLRLDDGSIVLVNRGFVPPDWQPMPNPPDEYPPIVVRGLLRLTEPRGGFLRRNDAAADRWYSRDVQAIASARGLQPTAPYFIDEDAQPAGHLTAAAPVGGLTVVTFRNSHLAYALTWYTLAAMIPFLFWRARRQERPGSTPSRAA